MCGFIFGAFFSSCAKVDKALTYLQTVLISANLLIKSCRKSVRIHKQEKKTWGNRRESIETKRHKSNSMDIGQVNTGKKEGHKKYKILKLRKYGRR